MQDGGKAVGEGLIVVNNRIHHLFQLIEELHLLGLKLSSPTVLAATRERAEVEVMRMLQGRHQARQMGLSGTEYR
jgi:hypothetical protein